MGMNELGPRRCPFTFASAILKETLSLEKESKGGTRSLRTWGKWGSEKYPEEEGITSVLSVLNSVGLISGWRQQTKHIPSKNTRSRRGRQETGSCRRKHGGGDGEGGSDRGQKSSH